MKKIVLLLIVAAVVFSFKTKSNNSLAEVNQIGGYYIFAQSKPVADFEHLGTIKGPLMGEHDFDNLVQIFIKKAKKKYPNGNAIVFDGPIKQTHNTSVSIIKFKE